MSNIKVYEPPYVPCKICNNKQSTFLPICENEGERFWYPVCVDCRDKVPYKVIPVVMEMGPGYYVCPETYMLKEAPEIDCKDFDPKKPILTKYGKKLLLKNNLL